jgi:hypothetical protein
MVLQVEKAPVIIKTGVSKADAEAMQKQLEAGETAAQQAAADVMTAADHMMTAYRVCTCSVLLCASFACKWSPASLRREWEHSNHRLQRCTASGDSLPVTNAACAAHNSHQSTDPLRLLVVHCLCCCCCHAVGGKVVME